MTPPKLIIPCYVMNSDVLCHCPRCPLFLAYSCLLILIDFFYLQSFNYIFDQNVDQNLVSIPAITLSSAKFIISFYNISPP